MRTRFPAALLVLAIALAACGSDSPDSKPASATPNTDYIRKANAICRDQTEKAPEFPGQSQGNGFVTTASQVIPYLEEVNKLSAASLKQLRALSPPPGREAAARRLVAAQEVRVEGLSLALRAARKGDGKAFTAAFQRDQKTYGPRYARAAARLGLTACTG